MKISTVEEMHEMDKRAIEKYGMEDKMLMENAGNAVYFVILKNMGNLDGKRFVVFAGPGNNGGDALVVARKLHSNGANVKVYLMSDPEKYRNSAKKNYEIANKMGIAMEKFEGDNALVRMSVESSDGVVDGIFGTGLSRDVEGKYKEAIKIINESGKKIFSVDIPSGINGNTGKIMGIAVKANYTVTFGLPKIGNIMYPGYEYCGKIYVSHISFPPENYEREDVKIEMNDPLEIPPRKKEGHKGTFGDALFISGARGYYGAPYFSSLSFLKAGGGYSRLASPKSLIPFIGAGAREVVYHPLPETDDGSISYTAKDEIIKISQNVDFVVLGPGTSLNERTQKLVVDLIPLLDKPLLVDGDGLTALSKNPDILKQRKEKTVITPHIGEMARLTKLDKSEILEKRIEIARNFAIEYNVVVVLKGAHTQIAMPDGKIYINMSGNPGMATAGSGDVLTGAIAAMYGLGLSFEEAVRMGVFVHGFAGDIAAEMKGEDGITARDIMDALPRTMDELRKNFYSVKEKYRIEIV